MSTRNYVAGEVHQLGALMPSCSVGVCVMWLQLCTLCPPSPSLPPTHRCGLLPPFTCSVSEAAQPGTCLSQTQGCWHDPRGHKRPQRGPASQPHAVSQGQTQHCSPFSCMHAYIHIYMINMHIIICMHLYPLGSA